jgi:hypothetical protein
VDVEKPHERQAGRNGSMSVLIPTACTIVRVYRQPCRLNLESAYSSHARANTIGDTDLSTDQTLVTHCIAYGIPK